MFGQYKFNTLLKHPGYNGGGKGGGGGSQTSTTVQKADPWSGVQPYLTEAYSRASQIYAPGQGPQYYPGQTYVSPDPLTLQSRQQLLDYAQNGAQNDVNTIRGSYGTLLGAADVNNNPYLANAVQGAINPIVSNLTQNILPSIRSGAVQTGQYGGSRQGLAEGTAIGQATRNIGDISSQMYSNAYNQGLDTLSKAMLFGPQMMQLAQVPSQLVGQVGAANEATAGQALQDAMNRYNYQQQLPYGMLSNYMSLLQGATPYASGSSTQVLPNQNYSSPLSGAAGGAMLGSNFGPMGTIGGGLLGALFG